MLSTGPLWVLTVRTAGPVWASEIEAHMPVRTATIVPVESQQIVAVAARPVGGTRRIDMAWSITGHLCAAALIDPMFTGVGLDVHLDGLSVAASPDTIAGVAAGRNRRWWRAQVDLTVG